MWHVLRDMANAHTPVRETDVRDALATACHQVRGLMLPLSGVVLHKIFDF